MNSGMPTEDDDYWNETKQTRFSFDPDDMDGLVSSFNKLDAITTSGTENTRSSTDRDSIVKESNLFSTSSSLGEQEKVPENVLNQILAMDNDEWEDEVPCKIPPAEEVRLLRKQIKGQFIEQNPEKVIRSIIHARPFTLEPFKSLSSKKSLLDEAIKIGDGDAILTIVLFLTQTLKKSLLCEVLMDRPVAVSHYTHYLFIRRKMQELNEVCEMLGKTEDMAMYQLSIITQNPKKVLQRLRVFNKNNMLNNPDRQLVQEYLKLIDWQTEASKINGDESIVGLSVADTIKYACKHNEVLAVKTDSNSTTCSKMDTESQIINLAKYFCLSDKMCLMTRIRAYTEIKDWKMIEKLIMSKGWISGEKLTVSTYVIDLILKDMQTAGTPTELIDRILLLLSDDEKIDVGRKLKRHTIVIDTLVKNRDKQELLRYMATLQPQSADYLYAEISLKNSQNRWKS